ncbi:MAG TPA: creatininase family protein [Candidatus Solibacter sp.]|nr:creatininase family protein [Candidatus Solibacter sp.]
MQLAHFTAHEFKAAPPHDKVVIAPLGAFEQHGLHLPFTTDTDIVTAIAAAVEQLLPDRVLLLPTLWIGHSTHHMHWAGTLDIRQMHYIAVIQDLCRSILATGAKKLLLLNGHGGNDIPVRAALREVKTECAGREGIHVLYAAYWMLAAASIRQIRESELGGLGHACEMETSLMLHLHPERVRIELARRDGPQHTSPYRKADMQHAKPAYSVNEFHEISESGVVGHPDLATAAKGKRFFDAIVTDVRVFVEDLLTW